MKKFAAIFGMILFLYSCREEGVSIDFTSGKTKLQGDTEYVSAVQHTPQPKNVLLEDITGVRCQNCPPAHDMAAAIADANPGRIIVSSLHAYSFGLLTAPIPGKGYPDFRDSTADYIVTQLLGNPNQIPIGAVNRKLFIGESKRSVAYSKWSTYVNKELLLTSPINLEVSNSYNPSNRELTTVVRMECTQDVSDTIYLSVGITENGILGDQLNGANVVQNYSHNHVFRKMLTEKTGMRVNSSTLLLNSKKVIVRVFKYNIPTAWNVQNCNVIGILHQGSSAIDVLHCTEKKIL